MHETPPLHAYPCIGRRAPIRTSSHHASVRHVALSFDRWFVRTVEFHLTWSGSHGVHKRPKPPMPIKPISAPRRASVNPTLVRLTLAPSFGRLFPLTMMYASLVHWLALAVALAVPFVTALGSVPYPQDDPFYYPSENGWQNEAPGTILRERKIQAASLGIFEWQLDSWQVL